MADYLKGLFGGVKSSIASAIPSADDAGFADFAGAPDPTPASISPSSISSASFPSSVPTYAPRVAYTKWYRVWERTQVSDFYNEMIIAPFILLVVLIHLWGTRANKKRATAWITKHAPILEQEFAAVGFGGRKSPSLDSVQSEGLLKASASDDLNIPEELLKQNSASEFVTYATGRQNTAFLDVKLSLLKRYNPLIVIGEEILGFFFDSMAPTRERMEATQYAFDGNESALVPGESVKKAGNSTYDGFVWAIVNKDLMKQLRGDRYDISLTSTKDHPKLPPWCTVMSESSEVTEVMLTPELIKAVHEAGDLMDALVITDQPLEKPTKLNETIPRKRVTLSIRLPSSPSDYAATTHLFQYYLRLPDYLTSNARFRPEVMRKIRATREEEIKKIKKVDDDEKAEERKLQTDKEKKEKRDAMLKSLSSVEQAKFLDREREKEQRRAQKRRTQRA